MANQRMRHAFSSAQSTASLKLILIKDDAINQFSEHQTDMGLASVFARTTMCSTRSVAVCGRLQPTDRSRSRDPIAKRVAHI
jgi:hypothetical protein